MGTSLKDNQQELSKNFVFLAKSEHTHPKEHKQLKMADPGETITATIILRRRTDGQPMKKLESFKASPGAGIKHVSHKDFAGLHGASPDELAKVVAFAKSNGLEVKESDASRRSVVVKGTAEQINKAFSVQLQHFSSSLGEYHSHEGAARVPKEISEYVENVIGLDNRPVPARHFDPGDGSADPPNTNSLMPGQVANLYNFPQGGGGGQTIGIYEMTTQDGDPGFAQADIDATMQAFGGGLKSPTPVFVSVDGQGNNGQSDGETLLDITVSSAVAQDATIAVYFTGGSSTQNIIHALQRMIHPGQGDPVPTVISISYGWSPDETTQYITADEFNQMSALFQDAAHLGITVLVSSGDSGVEFTNPAVQEASYPATDPWVIACGGTTIGNINGSNFTEYVWNDSWKGIGQQDQHGATGGGVSGFFPVPSYQNGFSIPVSLATQNPGRGIPDIAGNASPVSGYPQSIGGQVGGEGGTSAVAPLYAGLIAVINANLGQNVGFINPLLYSLSSTAFRKVVGPPGPSNNAFGGLTGYQASGTWNACTGLGSVDGVSLQNGLKNALQQAPQAVAG